MLRTSLSVGVFRVKNRIKIIYFVEILVPLQHTNYIEILTSRGTLINLYRYFFLPFYYYNCIYSKIHLFYNVNIQVVKVIT